jgi:hypothetical protein
MSAVQYELIIRQLSAGGAEPVLVADFQPFSATPRISELLSGWDDGRPVYQIDPLAALSHDQLYISLPDLTAACAEAFLSSQPAGGHIFVVGHCSAAALSLHLARLLESRREVTVILVRPSWPGEDVIRDRFAEFLANMGAANRPCPDLDGDPCSSVGRLEQVLRDELVLTAAAQGLDGSTGAFSDLLVRYRAWLAFLLACRNDPPGTWATETSTIRVLTDAPADAAIPGLSPGACHVSRLPVLDHDYSLTELAEAVFAQLPTR